MTTLRRWITPLFALAWALAAPAWAQIDAATAERLMRQSGLWQQLGSQGPQMRQGLEQGLAEAGPAVPEAARQRLLGEAGAAFAAGPLRATAQRELAATVRVEHLPALWAWFGSAAGQAVARAEAAAAADERDSELVIRQGAALLTAATEARRATLARVVEAAGAARALTDVVAEIAVAVRAAIVRAAPAAGVPGADTLRAELQAQRPQLLEGFRQMAWTLFAVTYRDLPDAMLDDYVRMLGTPAGEQFNDASEGAFLAAVLAALGTLAR